MAIMSFSDQIPYITDLSPPEKLDIVSQCITSTAAAKLTDSIPESQIPATIKDVSLALEYILTNDLLKKSKLGEEVVAELGALRRMVNVLHFCEAGTHKVAEGVVVRRKDEVWVDLRGFAEKLKWQPVAPEKALKGKATAKGDVQEVESEQGDITDELMRGKGERLIIKGLEPGTAYYLEGKKM